MPALEIYFERVQLKKTGAFDDDSKVKVTLLLSLYKPRVGLTVLTAGRSLSVPRGRDVQYSGYLTQEDEDPHSSLLFFDSIAPQTELTAQALVTQAPDSIGDLLVKVFGALLGSALSGPAGTVSGVLIGSVVDKLTKHDPQLRCIGKGLVQIPALQPVQQSQLALTLSSPKAQVISFRTLPSSMDRPQPQTETVSLGMGENNGQLVLRLVAL